MKYGICNISSIPIRKEPADSSEMRTEILFGEHFVVLEEIERWAKIKLCFDNYEGWIDKKIIQYISHSDVEKIENSFSYITFNKLNIIRKKDDNIDYFIGGGSTLPAFKNNEFYIGEDLYIFEGERVSLNKSELRNNIVNFANQYLKSSYLWGGRNPFGIDCSGLSQIAYKACGINILRDASQQVSHGNNVSFINDAQEGDLAFFDNSEGIITHVGIVQKDRKIIHASGKVRIDMLDQQGIYNHERKMYTHKLRIIKNLID